ncbi:hypothetical protein CN481_04835 [Bacillus sp. AFS006103]|nr:hypothetical protein CN481_04835 [Bacillus sp. AFS006103]
MTVNFRDAYIYLENSTPTDIYKRIIPYYVYTNNLNKPIGRFALLTIMGAVNGPLEFNHFKKPHMEEFLNIRHYEKEIDWYLYVDEWAAKYIRNNADEAYYKKMWDIIMQKDAAISQLMFNHEFRHREYYLPELVAFGFFNDHWPRV